MNKINTYVFCIFVYFSVVSSEDPMATFMKAAVDCRKELNASDDDMEVLLKDLVAQNRNQACLLSCFGTKTGIINTDGTYKIEESLKMLEAISDPSRKSETEQVKGKLKTALEFCNQQQKKDIKDLCDATKEYQACYVKKAQELDLTRITIKM